MGEDAVLGSAVADAGYWSEANAASETEECELFIATRKDHKQRADLRDAPPPRGRMPKTMSARARMERKLRTKRGRALYRQRASTVEPVFGQMKDRQGADRFSMRGRVARIATSSYNDLSHVENAFGLQIGADCIDTSDFTGKLRGLIIYTSPTATTCL